MAVCALMASPTLGTSVLQVEPSTAVDRAELIFTGRVVDVEFVPSGDGLYPFTFVTFEVAETLKGQVQGEEIVLRLDGGDLPAREESVEVVGMPIFEVGDEMLLFVAGNGKNGCPIVGWWQGRLDLVQHPKTGENLFIDHRGAPVEGLVDQTWLTADLRYNAAEKSLVAGEPDSQLLWQDGVTIVEEEPVARAEAYAGVQAEQVLDQLRSLIAARRLQKSFVADRVVESASPYDVPETVQFTATPNQ